MRSKKNDTILAHTVARVMIADGVNTLDDASTWKAAKAVPKASRITLFIVQWAHAERDLGRELSGIDEYREFWDESERSAYRRQSEFREVWGTDAFRIVVDAVKAEMDAAEKRLRQKLNVGRAMSLPVTL